MPRTPSPPILSPQVEVLEILAPLESVSDTELLVLADTKMSVNVAVQVVTTTTSDQNSKTSTLHNSIYR